MLSTFRRPFGSRIPTALLLGGIGIVTLLGLLISLVATVSQPISSSNLGKRNSDYPDSQRRINLNDAVPSMALDSTLIQTYKRGTCRTSTWGPEWTVDSNGGVCRHGELGRNGCCLPRTVIPTVTQLPIHPRGDSTSRSPLSSDHTPLYNPPTEAIQRPVSELAPSEGQSSPATALPSIQDFAENTKSSVVPDSMLVPTCSSEYQCCAQYEFCVSSCLDFTWQRLHSIKTHRQSAMPTDNKAIDAVDRLMMDHQKVDQNVVKAYEEGTEDLFDWCLSRCRTSGRSVVHQNSFRSSLKYCYGIKDPPLLARNVRKGDSD